MVLVTVSPHYHVVIPKHVRQALGIVPGQKLQVVVVEDRIELLPLRPIEELRGFLHGIDGPPDREHDRQ